MLVITTTIITSDLDSATKVLDALVFPLYAAAPFSPVLPLSHLNSFRCTRWTYNIVLSYNSYITVALDALNPLHIPQCIIQQEKKQQSVALETNLPPKLQTYVPSLTHLNPECQIDCKPPGTNHTLSEIYATKQADTKPLPGLSHLLLYFILQCLRYPLLPLTASVKAYLW